jgi:hypothetical protein
VKGKVITLICRLLTGPVQGRLPVIALTAGLLAGPLAATLAAEPSASAVTNEREPALELRETTQDGGTVEQGTVVKYRFTLANHGQVDLEITQVKPGCGCTASRWDRLIRPGAEGVIEAEVDTRSFRGPIAKRLTVTTNDPARPRFQLNLTAKVTPALEVTPGVSALLVVEDRPVCQEFILEHAGGKPMQIRHVTVNAPFAKAETVPLPGEGRYKLTVTASTETPLGRSAVPVIVQTDLASTPRLTLMVNVERGIVSMPPLLFWSLGSGPVELPVRGAVLLSRQKGAFHVTGVAVDDEKLEAKLETLKNGREYRVLITYHGGWEAGLVRKTLTVTTDDPKQPQIRVPVQVALPQPAAR